MIRFASRKTANLNKPSSDVYFKFFSAITGLGTMFAIGYQAHASHKQTDALSNQALALSNQNDSMLAIDHNHRCDVLRNKLQLAEAEFTDLLYGPSHRESSDGIATIRGIAVKSVDETNDDTLNWYIEKLPLFQDHVNAWKIDYKVFSAHSKFKDVDEYEANKIRSHCKDYWNRILKKASLYNQIRQQLIQISPNESVAELLTWNESKVLFDRYSRLTRWAILFDSKMNVDVKNELLYKPSSVGKVLIFDDKDVQKLTKVLDVVKDSKDPEHKKRNSS